MCTVALYMHFSDTVNLRLFCKLIGVQVAHNSCHLVDKNLLYLFTVTRNIPEIVSDIAS